MALSGFSLNLVMVEKYSHNDIDFLTCTLHKYLGGIFFGEQAYLQLMKQAQPQQLRLSNTRERS